MGETEAGTGAAAQVERRIVEAKEIKVNDPVLYVDRSGIRHALVVKNFEPDMRTPHLTVAFVKRGELGLTTRSFVPHRFRATPKDEGYWVFPSEEL